MYSGDITTKKTYKSGDSCVFIIEKDWLRYLGFSEKEIEKGDVELVFKAEQSEKHKQPFIGFGKRRG